jgi:hypothetical protein
MRRAQARLEPAFVFRNIPVNERRFAISWPPPWGTPKPGLLAGPRRTGKTSVRRAALSSLRRRRL